MKGNFPDSAFLAGKTQAADKPWWQLW